MDDLPLPLSALEDRAQRRGQLARRLPWPTSAAPADVSVGADQDRAVVGDLSYLLPAIVLRNQAAVTDHRQADDDTELAADLVHSLLPDRPRPGDQSEIAGSGQIMG